VGEVTATSETTATRVLRRTTAPMRPGLRVVVSSQVYWSDPEQSFGIVQEALVGARGTPEDTPPARFATVRPRVQIPGPRLFLT